MAVCVDVLPHVRMQLLEHHRVLLRVCVGAGAAFQVCFDQDWVPLVQLPCCHDHIHGALREGENGSAIILVLQSRNHSFTGERDWLTARITDWLEALRRRAYGPRHGSINL